MAMSVTAIVKEILNSLAGEKITLDQLTTRVENHYAYSGKKTEDSLKKEINSILVQIKLGRIKLSGEIEL